MVFFLAAGFWAFVVVWDGKIHLWETLGFLVLYVIYILIIVVGRYVNQKMKAKRHGSSAVRKNDFSSGNLTSSTRAQASTSQNASINDQETDEEERAEREYDGEAVTEQLLPRVSPNLHMDSPEVVFSSGQALMSTLIPIDMTEWRQSNIIFKLMIIVKVRT